MHVSAAARFQGLAQHHGLGAVPAAFNPVGGRNAHAHGDGRGQGGAHGVKHLQHKAHAVFQRAAIRIGALVGQGRQKLVHQIAVCGVQLNHFKPQALRALGAGHKRGGDALDGGGVQGLRRLVVRVERQGRGGHHRPAAVLRGDGAATGPRHRCGRLAPGVAELNADRDGRVAAQRLEHTGQRGFVVVVPQPQVLRRNAANGFNGGGFQQQQAGARHGHLAQVHQVPVGGVAVFGRVLAHGRNDDAVGQRDRTDGIRGEQLAHRGVLEKSGGKRTVREPCEKKGAKSRFSSLQGPRQHLGFCRSRSVQAALRWPVGGVRQQINAKKRASLSVYCLSRYE